jgi:hypothetical protein
LLQQYLGPVLLQKFFSTTADKIEWTSSFNTEHDFADIPGSLVTEL